MVSIGVEMRIVGGFVITSILRPAQRTGSGEAEVAHPPRHQEQRNGYEDLQADEDGPDS